jgi:hypothetical protein
MRVMRRVAVAALAAVLLVTGLGMAAPQSAGAATSAVPMVQVSACFYTTEYQYGRLVSVAMASNVVDVQVYAPGVPGSYSDGSYTTHSIRTDRNGCISTPALANWWTRVRLYSSSRSGAFGAILTYAGASNWALADQNLNFGWVHVARS